MSTQAASGTSSDGVVVAGLRHRRRGGGGGESNAVSKAGNNGHHHVESSSSSSSSSVVVGNNDRSEKSHPTSSHPPPVNVNDLPKYENWDDIVSSAVVVNGLDAAVSRVVPPSSPPTLSGVFRLLTRFWRWNIPLLSKVVATWGVFHVLASSYYRFLRTGDRDGDGEEASYLFPLDLLRSVAVGVRRIVVVQVLGLAYDDDSSSNELSVLGVMRVLLGVVVKLSIATFVLLFLRVVQRLSWHTTEFGTYPNIKHESTYQDDKLLDEAWSRGYESCGWHDPTKEGGGSGGDVSSTRVMFQPREGYCGMASFNSVLRTFLLPPPRHHRRGSNCEDEDAASPPDEDDADGNAASSDDDDYYDPYVRLHSLPRYVTLEEAHEFFLERFLGSNSLWDGASPSTTPIVSVEVVGGGKNGFASYKAFVRALKQMNHPTQPARVLAIYGRSPLFFCDGTGVRGTLRRILTFGMGHWSPIVSYLEDEDLVLVMDVNRKYGPRGYMVPTRRMFDAVNTRCVMTGNYRGLILLRGPPPSDNNDASLITDPTDLSRAFGDMKEAYYRHIATSGNEGGPGEKMSFTVDEVMDSSDGDMDETIGSGSGSGSGSDGRRCVRWVTLGEDGEGSSTRQRGGPSCGVTNNGLRAVLSLHPMTFTNMCFLPRGHGRGYGDDGGSTDDDLTAMKNPPESLEHDVRRMMGAFEALRVPMTVAVRGCPDGTTNDEIHRVLCSAGLVPAKPGTTSFYLNILPEDGGSLQDMCRPLLSEGFEIHELRTASTSARDADLIRQWGQVVADSYGFRPSIIRHGRSPGQFLGDAYQVVSHGDHLRQFVCIERETDRVVACSTLYRNPDVDPRVACMFNVCVLKEYRGLKLGTIMSRCVIVEAANAGCIQVILEASPKGRPVYERLGFVASTEEYGGMYVRIGIATESWRWKVVFKMLETAMWIKNR